MEFKMYEPSEREALISIAKAANGIHQLLRWIIGLLVVLIVAVAIG